MKKSLFKILLLCLISLTNFGYSEALYYVENIETYNIEEIEYCVDPNDLALISGKLFLNCSGALVPIKNLRYEGQTLFVTSTAYTYYCTNCQQWVFINHVCPKK